jgi:hypothetical protein
MPLRAGRSLQPLPCLKEVFLLILEILDVLTQHLDFRVRLTLIDFERCDRLLVLRVDSFAQRLHLFLRIKSNICFHRFCPFNY